MGRTIQKKSYPVLFEPLLIGKKTFDIRLADFEVNIGDRMLFCEYDQLLGYTGRSCVRNVTYKLYIRLDSEIHLEHSDISFWSQEQIKKHGLWVLSFESFTKELGCKKHEIFLKDCMVCQEVHIRRRVLELSDLLICYHYHEIDASLRSLTQKHEYFFGKAFLNESM